MNYYDAFMTPRERADLLAEMSQKGFFKESAPSAAVAAKPSEGAKPEMLTAPSLAMVYSPKQAFRGLYSPDMALSRGTLFEGLDKPLMANMGGKK